MTPYSWSYQGGVNRHIEALAGELIQRGDEVRVFAPYDPPGALSKIMHRADPMPVTLPDYLVPLGRTVGINANGAVSNLSLSPAAVVKMRREINRGGFDVIHVHEPVAPLLAWDAARSRAPVVGTFHAYSTKALPNHIASMAGARRMFNRLTTRVAVSEAAAWTGRRWFGGRYEIVPNGVDLSLAPDEPKPQADHLRVLFVGRPEARKGLPVLLQAFGGLAEQVPARLTIIGAEHTDVMRYLADQDLLDLIETHGRVSSPQLWRAFHEADVLAAPSLAGESFGMVLTESFAAGTPVIASAIAGYSDVVTDGVDGVLVPPADAQRLAEELQRAHHEPERLKKMGEAARRSAERYAWPRVAADLRGVYERAIEVPEPATRSARLAVRAGLAPADGSPRVPPERLPSLEPELVLDPAAKRHRLARRIAIGTAGALALGLTALAANRIGIDRVATSIVRSDVSWLLWAFGLMCLSLFFRAASWLWIARTALPSTPLRRRDVTSATMIGVLMSATLPARLGEPARVLVLARRTGRMRESFPVLVGTLVSQTMLNILALVLLGAIIISSTDLFSTSTTRIFAFSLLPLALLILVLVAPVLLRAQGSGRLARAGEAVRGALVQVRRGLSVFRNPQAGPIATVSQLGAWAIQLASCWALIFALGLNDQIGIGAAAAVLFAVNVTAVVPVTPSNIGVFQLAVISVLSTGFGVGTADALAYGIILQAVEIATAVVLGVPALLREGLTWSDLRMQALSATPVRLGPKPPAREPGRA